MGVRVKAQILTLEEVAERNARFRAADPRISRDDFERAELAERGTALFFWQPDGAQPGFSWLCPGCATWHYGPLGDEPVSGWDDPHWVNSGTADRPTLTPSLGCPGWRRGTCEGGHYWLRDGELVPA
jgi:Family of unknown function (DUF6527)